MPQKNIKTFIYPIVALAIFTLLVFGAGYAYFNSSILNASATYQVDLPKQTSLICTKTDCGVTITPAMMTAGAVSSTEKAASTCSITCTCTGTQNAVCSYNVSLIELGSPYTPSATLGTNNEFTVNVTSGTGCSPQNTSNTAKQVNTIKDKVVSSCSLTVPASGTITSTVSAIFKWYNLNLDQSAHASKSYAYQLTTESNTPTVTFDANGGSVSPTSKKVSYHAQYGTLPTPTYSGHTFKGWNGINLYNPDTMTISNTSHTAGTETITFAGNVYDRILGKSAWTPKTNTWYTLVLDISSNSFNQSIGLRADTRFYVESYTNADISAGKTGKHVVTFKTRSDFSSVTLGSFWFQSSNTITGSMTAKMAIYEGTSYTEYEPYYIKSTSQVIQSGNHTLKAIW